jgi:glutamyl-tRNA reductase
LPKKTAIQGKILNQLLQRAFKVGKKTYLETSIHKGAISISLAAVELAREIYGSLAHKTVLIVGAGETAQLTAECLLKKRVGKDYGNEPNARSRRRFSRQSAQIE